MQCGRSRICWLSLKTIDNGCDDLAVRRIINVPKRGIGLTSINRVQEYAAGREIGFYEPCGRWI